MSIEWFAATTLQEEIESMNHSSLHAFSFALGDAREIICVLFSGATYCLLQRKPPKLVGILVI